MPHALTALALLARLAASASAPEELPSVELSDALGANAPPNATSGFQPKEMEVPEAPVDESWRSQPRAGTGTIDPLTCKDTATGRKMACFDFSTALCTHFEEAPCKCSLKSPICVTDSGKRSSPASKNHAELHSCCTRPGTAEDGMLLSEQNEASPFAKQIMARALSSWTEKTQTKCFSQARSGRGVISLTDCKTKCLEEKREVEPKDCEAILFKEKSKGKGLCFVLFGLDEPSCEKSEVWHTYVKKRPARHWPVALAPPWRKLKHVRALAGSRAKTGKVRNSLSEPSVLPKRFRFGPNGMGGMAALLREAWNVAALVLDEMQSQEDLATTHWDADGVRCRHGVCFKVIHPEVTQTLPFVSTEPAAQAMRQLLLAIGVQSPVLLSGPSGVGKTTFLRRAAQLMGQHEPVFLFCDEQTDIKMLLGAYVCGQTVGEFLWRPGVVTEALQKGRWLVLEDVDRVPAEVLAALLPLADSRRLVIPERNQRIEAHQDFQLFGTFSCGSQPVLWTESGPDNEASCCRFPWHVSQLEFAALARQLLMQASAKVPALVSAWTRVWLGPLREQDLSKLLTGHYPELASITEQLLASAALLRQRQALEGPAAAPPGHLETGVEKGRDILRWCARLRNAKLVLSPIFTEESRSVLLREALQVLLGRVADVRLRRSFLASLAPLWSLDSGVADALLQERPTVSLLPDVKQVQIGDILLPLAKGREKAGEPFAYTSVHARVLQALASAVRSEEPALLVGDTGTGKTSVVQHVGRLLGREVLVYNFNEQSESTELIGGFRPVDNVMQLMSELVETFCTTFEKSFSRRKNANVLEKIRGDFLTRRWAAVLHGIGSIISKAQGNLSDPVTQASKGVKSSHLATEWERVCSLRAKATSVVAAGSAPKFEFKEGLLVQALRSGAWVVLDEINLAPSDLLQRIQGLIERSSGTHLALPESGDEHVVPHADFRLFACMNPPPPPSDEGEVAGDLPMGARAGQAAGKKELPPGIRGRFTEIFVDEVHTSEDLGHIVRSYLERDLPNPPCDAIVGFYKHAALLCRQSSLLDGAGRVSYFSLRNLTRALRFALRLARRAHHALPAKQALAQGLAVGFATTLDLGSSKVVEDMIKEALGVSPVLGAKDGTSSTAAVKMDADQGWINVEGYWIKAGPQKVDIGAAHQDFVITTSVRRNLQNIARMLSGGRFPILLEGPTSAGKTSLVKFLAKLTGHEFVRINNHEHTDLQEYVGQYVCDPDTGQLVFQEGVLVRAARAGHWVVLDELNLAPSEVLEALNRLLDDNRELYIPDTGNTVKPHEEFMVFATQNPAGANYGGRKSLSRAFRNRFTELFVSELPMEELAVVLHKRCQVPPSYVKVMLAVYADLQSHRNQSAVFLGKQSFMTVRDLLRWGHRKPNSYLELAVEGWALLAERLRKKEEREVVRTSLQKHCAGVKDLQVDYTQDAVVTDARARVEQKLQAGEQVPGGLGQVVWTPAFCRMVALIGRCVRAGEPALLVGETGGGKTMACQLLSWALVEEGLPERRLRTLNCHQQTETSDFIGSLRPVRGRDAIFSAITATAQNLAALMAREAAGGGGAALERLQREVKSVAEGKGNLKHLAQALRVALAKEENSGPPSKRRRQEGGWMAMGRQLLGCCGDYERIFEWADGALVEAMRCGGAFLVDEISLAE
ncbi:unnamed protein product, partial [Effrenium voratum]